MANNNRAVRIISCFGSCLPLKIKAFKRSTVDRTPRYPLSIAKTTRETLAMYSLKMCSYLHERFTLFIGAGTITILLILSTSGSGHGFVIEADEMYNPLDKFNEEDPLTSMIKRTLITRLDVCACCASKHISFCCTACMKQKGLLQQQDGDVISTDQNVFTKLSNLKLSSCACCELSGRRGKCCSWCPRLASVEK